MHFNYFTTYYFHNAGAFLWTPHHIWADYDFEIDVEEIRRLKRYSQTVGSPGFNQALLRLWNLGTFFQTTPEGFKLNENVFPAGLLAGVIMHYGLHRPHPTIEPFIYFSF